MKHNIKGHTWLKVNFCYFDDHTGKNGCDQVDLKINYDGPLLTFLKHLEEEIIRQYNLKKNTEIEDINIIEME